MPRPLMISEQSRRSRRLNNWKDSVPSLAKRVSLVVGLSVLFGALTLIHRTWPLDLFSVAAMTFISALAIILTRFHLGHRADVTVSPVKAETIIWAVAGLGILGVETILLLLKQADMTGKSYLLLAPLTAQAMLVSALIGPALALYSLTVCSFLLGLSGSLPIELLATSWLSGAIGAHAVNPLKQRSDLVRAMTIQALAQTIIAICASAMDNSHVQPVVASAGWAALSALVAVSIFWLAVAILERLFDITSDWSLLELCSPDHPLIKELCLRSPGTYAHSVMVGNLAEQAARAIGANPVHCRAMAYFHDVGKIQHPGYFIENQVGVNYHDDLPPMVSARIILSHVSDGLQLAKEYRLPQVIRDGIAQHHGTSLVSYFYNRALKQEPDLEADSLATLFRYEGPRPQTRETAILHLADQIEAASRTMGRSTTEDIEIMVAKIIEGSRADGQLDESPLTFRDIHLIRQAFLRSLSALRHERIEYPDQEHASPHASPDFGREREFTESYSQDDRERTD